MEAAYGYLLVCTWMLDHLLAKLVCISCIFDIYLASTLNLEQARILLPKT
jgi:hypothetical protein